MQTNVGTADRLVRIVVAVALLAALFVADGGVRWLGLVGLVPLATALLRWCPLYTVLGLNTCPVGGNGYVADNK